MEMNHILEGLHGPGSFRFIIQPLIAVLLGFRDGKLDALLRKPPYFLSLLSSSNQRKTNLKSGIASIIKPLILAWGMDTAFQVFVLGTWSPFQATFVGILLVALPYILVRGLTNRTMTGTTSHGP